MKPAQAYKKGIRPSDVRTIQIADKFAGAWLVVIDDPSRPHGFKILYSGSIWGACHWESQLLKVHDPDVFVCTGDIKPATSYKNLKVVHDA